MVRITTARLSAAALALVAVSGLHSTLVQAAPEGKVSICHFDGKGRTHLISIDESAVPAHVRNHGDMEALLVFADEDEDTFGGGDPEVRCDVPEGAVLRGGDCDDANAAINPGAEDNPDTEIDENCSDETEESPGA